MVSKSPAWRCYKTHKYTIKHNETSVRKRTPIQTFSSAALRCVFIGEFVSQMQQLGFSGRTTGLITLLKSIRCKRLCRPKESVSLQIRRVKRQKTWQAPDVASLLSSVLCHPARLYFSSAQAHTVGQTHTYVRCTSFPHWGKGLELIWWRRDKACLVILKCQLQA